MHLGVTNCRLSGANPWEGGNAYGPCQNSGNFKLANPYLCQTSTILHGFLQLLPPLHFSIFTHRTTIEPANKEGHSLGMGSEATTCIRNASEVNYLRTSPHTAQTRRTIRNRSRRFRIRNRSYPHPKRQKREKTSDCLFFCHPNQCRTKLRHLRTGILCNSPSITSLEAICCRIPPQDQGLYGPSKPTILEATPQNPPKNCKTCTRDNGVPIGTHSYPQKDQQLCQHAI